MLLCHTCIYIHTWVCSRMHTNTHTPTRTQTGLLFLQPALLQSRRHRPITITGPDLHQKNRKGPTQRPRGLVRNPQVSERIRQKEGKARQYFNTDLQALSCEQTSAAARPKGSRSSGRLRSPSSPGLNRAAPSLAVDTPGPLYGETGDIGEMRDCRRTPHCAE